MYMIELVSIVIGAPGARSCPSFPAAPGLAVRCCWRCHTKQTCGARPEPLTPSHTQAVFLGNGLGAILAGEPERRLGGGWAAVGRCLRLWVAVELPGGLAPRLCIPHNTMHSHTV
jgi:hypothetical protein